MPTKCYAVHCQNRKGVSGKDINYFRITKGRAKTWLKQLGTQGGDISFENILCSDHFESDMMIRKASKIILVKGAIPTLKLKRTPASFPLKNEELLKLWMQEIRRVNFTPTKFSKICSDHFTEHDYLVRPGSYVTKLKPDAVPSIFKGFPSYYKASLQKQRTLKNSTASSELPKVQPTCSQSVEIKSMVSIKVSRNNESGSTVSRLPEYGVPPTFEPYIFVQHHRLNNEEEVDPLKLDPPIENNKVALVPHESTETNLAKPNDDVIETQTNFEFITSNYNENIGTNSLTNPTKLEKDIKIKSVKVGPPKKSEVERKQIKSLQQTLRRRMKTLLRLKKIKEKNELETASSIPIGSINPTAPKLDLDGGDS